MAKTHYRIIAATWLALSTVTLADDGSSTPSGDANPSNSEDAGSRSKEDFGQNAAACYDLKIEAPVHLAASDDAAKTFQDNVLPGILKEGLTQLPDGKSDWAQNVASAPFDPSKLVLNTDSTARMYFLGDGAGNKNTLGISTENDDSKNGGASLIFPIAANSEDAAKALRTSGQALRPGDFLDLGSLKAGSSLDFFLIAGGAADGSLVVSNDKSLNKDGIFHATAMETPGSPYLIVSFAGKGANGEDSKVFFAVDFGSSNSVQVPNSMLVVAPEPSLALGALLAGGVLLGFSRRRVA